MAAGLSADIMEQGVVVYGGDEIQRRTAGTACGVWQMAGVFDKTESQGRDVIPR
jgi:hypothetical protein